MSRNSLIETRDGFLVGAYSRLSPLGKLTVLMELLAELDHSGPYQLFQHLSKQDYPRCFSADQLREWCAAASGTQQIEREGVKLILNETTAPSLANLVSELPEGSWRITFQLVDGRNIQCVGTLSGGSWIVMPRAEPETSEAGFNARFIERLEAGIFLAREAEERRMS